MKRVTMAGASILLALIAGACNSSSKPAATPTTPTTTTSTPSATTTTTGSAPTSAPATTATGGGPGAGPSGRCTTSDLHVTLGQSNGAAGHSFQPIDFTNSSATSCTIKGYPGVSFVAANGDQIGAAADRQAATPVEITLAPRGETVATLEIVSLGVISGCDPAHQARAHSLRVYPPNNTQPVDIPWTVDECSSPTIHQLSISAVGRRATQ